MLGRLKIEQQNLCCVLVGAVLIAKFGCEAGLGDRGTKLEGDTSVLDHFALLDHQSASIVSTTVKALRMNGQRIALQLNRMQSGSACDDAEEDFSEERADRREVERIERARRVPLYRP